jgi:low affinity Fe/Cu permease
MDIVELLKTIKEDWALLVFVFGLGGAWIQGKMWFANFNRSFKEIHIKLDTEQGQHNTQTSLMTSLHDKIDNLETRVAKVEDTVSKVHEELHDQEVKLAVLESAQPRRVARK